MAKRQLLMFPLEHTTARPPWKVARYASAYQIRSGNKLPHYERVSDMIDPDSADRTTPYERVSDTTGPDSANRTAPSAGS
jgi:hypothetical protein